MCVRVGVREKYESAETKSGECNWSHISMNDHWLNDLPPIMIDMDK